MRSYDCHVWMFVGDKLKKSYHSTCWNMLFYPKIFDPTWKGSYDDTFAGKDIYISNFDYKETNKYQKTLVDLINEITPCEIVETKIPTKIPFVRKKIRLIRFRLLDSYNKSLVLLNFIRNLWHEPCDFKGYCVKFFENLTHEDNSYEDPLSRMLWANREACLVGKGKATYWTPGHSNVHRANSLVIKNKNQLLESNIYSTQIFLTEETKCAS